MGDRGEGCEGCAACAEQGGGDGPDEDCDGRTDCAHANRCDAARCSGPDVDGDSFAGCDGDDGNPTVCTTPGPVEGLVVVRAIGGAAELSWSPPAEPAGPASGEPIRYPRWTRKSPGGT